MKLRSKTVCLNEEAETNPQDGATSPHPFWQALPQEIRLMVLKELRQLADQRHQMAHWASVSKEWQYFFEPETLETLRICSPGSDIGRMDQVVRGYRRKLVRTISLHVGMAEYTSAEHGQPEDMDTIMANNVALAEALTALFSILSQWEKATSAHHVTLRLSAGSIADNHHPYKAFHNHFFRQQAQAGWALNAKKRLLGNLLDPDFQAGKLPQVPIIKQFSMDRHYYRSLSGASMEKILSRLPHLRAFKYQSWRAVDRNGHRARDAASKRILRTIVNIPSIRGVVFWEARSKAIHRSTRQYRPVNHSLVSAAVRASYRLQHLAISHAIDAAFFFQYHNTRIEAQKKCSKHLRDWPALTSLALTTDIGRLLSNPAEIDSLILGAGNAALRMPKLKIMEVWGPGLREGLFFHMRFGKITPRNSSLQRHGNCRLTWRLSGRGSG
ncbi:hypothetical protein LZ30DRAFT_603202 [Colletotrichum cereale]|nr:hypothetical protein LZ30DRAFT_603202 [Colletotrichum cereale]